MATSDIFVDGPEVDLPPSECNPIYDVCPDEENYFLQGIDVCSDLCDPIYDDYGDGEVNNEVKVSSEYAVCDADFTVSLSSVEGASIMTAVLPQYGQLGHSTDNEHNTKDTSVKLSYESQHRPKVIATLCEASITKVACGTNNNVAVDSQNLITCTWSFGGYGRLGHLEQKDEEKYSTFGWKPGRNSLVRCVADPTLDLRTNLFWPERMM